MTLIWLVIWFIANNIGDREALTVDPVNLWAGTLILAIGLDLGAHHKDFGSRRSGRHS